MITTHELRQELRKLWPNLDGVHGMILLKDKNGYYEPAVEEITKIVGPVESTITGLFNGQPENYDCDDYALDAYANVRQYFREIETLPVCFGQVIGNKFDGMFVNHTKNIFYSGRVYLLEPQTGVVKIADPKEDSVWFVEI